jgi:hypothetical protein
MIHAMLHWLCPLGMDALIVLTAIIVGIALGFAALAWIADHFDLPF